MGEWMKQHEALVKKSSTERSTVSVDGATKDLLKGLGIDFQEVKQPNNKK